MTTKPDKASEIAREIARTGFSWKGGLDVDATANIIRPHLPPEQGGDGGTRVVPAEIERLTDTIYRALAYHGHINQGGLLDSVERKSALMAGAYSIVYGEIKMALGARQAPPTADDLDAVLEALRQHHEWQLSQNEPDQHGIILSESYQESALCDETLSALAKLRAYRARTEAQKGAGKWHLT